MLLLASTHSGGLHNSIMHGASLLRNGDTHDPGEVLPPQQPWSTEAGENLKALRVAKGLGQSGLGVSRGTVSRLERGIGYPDRETVEALAAALGVAVGALLPSESDEGGAYRQGVRAALAAMEVALQSDVRLRLGLPVDARRDAADRASGKDHDHGAEGVR
jgi:transcriptional regulator with XRE-family HTH domain